MAQDSYILMLVPEAADASVERVAVEKRRLYWGSIFAMYVVGIVAIVFIHYTFLLGRNLESESLVAENERMRAEVAALAKKVDRAESDLYAARRLDEQLRSMTDLNDEDRALSMEVTGDAAARAGSATNPFIAELRQIALDRRTPGLLRKAKEHSALLGQVVDDLSRRAALTVGVPRSWPARGWITSHFGPRQDPGTREPAMHVGVDIAAPEGTEVQAPRVRAGFVCGRV